MAVTQEEKLEKYFELYWKKSFLEKRYELVYVCCITVLSEENSYVTLHGMMHTSTQKILRWNSPAKNLET